MLDNLRRSVSPPAVVLALIAGWAMPFDDAAVWTAFILSTIVLPPLIPVIARTAPQRPSVTLRSHFRALRAEFGLGLVQSGLMTVFLAHQAWLMGDAIIRTLVRLTVTRHHLLEWIPAAHAASSRRPSVWRFYRLMSGAVVIGASAIAVAWFSGWGTWPVASVFAVAWFASPAVAFWASLSPRIGAQRPLAEADAHALRLIARRTWRFFETFVTPADHMLPPDNFQEIPDPVVAHRTSPTNIGLYLLSAASARDLGWIGTLEATERLEATLSTMARMARCRGHFYNWYNTRDLRPLDPQYVSSVDSGNLAGHLIAAANACRDWRSHPLAEQRRFLGVADALDLARDEARRLRDTRQSRNVTWMRFDDELARLASGLRQASAGGVSAERRLADLGEQAAILVDTAREIAIEEDHHAGTDLEFWTEAVRACIESHRRDLGAQLAPLEARLKALEDVARSIALSAEFDFLLDPDRLLLSIGYQVAEGVLDPSCYDLLASEARLASFMAIAKGDVPARHWFRLSHAVIPVGNGAALISWSGSMFEYLMPSLVMRAPTESLVEQTNRLIVRRQIEYGATLKTPWGVSESAYNARNLQFTYQYSNFGIPGLGLKRGLADNAVVAPYGQCLGEHGRPSGCGAELRASRCHWRSRPVRLLRGVGLHARPGAERRARGRRPVLHGPPPGHDDHGHRRRPAGRRDAGPLPCRADHPGDGASSARTGDSRRYSDPAIGLRDQVERQDPGGRRRYAQCQSVERHARHPAAFERSLLSNAHRRRIRLQQLARPGRDPLAGGRHVRRLGLVYPPEGRRDRGGLVGDLSADRSRARRARGHFQRGTR